MLKTTTWELTRHRRTAKVLEFYESVHDRIECDSV